MESNQELYSELIGLPSKLFEENRKNFIRNLKQNYSKLNTNSLIIFEGGRLEPLYSSDCFYYFFDQESNFYYLTGVTEPHMKLVIDLTSEEATLFQEQEPEDYKTWMTVYSIEEIESKFNIKTKLITDFDSFIQSKSKSIIYTLGGQNLYSGIKAFAPQLAFKDSFAPLNAKVTPNDFIYNILCQTRLHKTANELDLIKYVAKISNEAIIEVIKAIRPGLNERDMENVYFNYLRIKYHCRLTSFNASSASGSNTAYMKYDINNRLMEDGDLFVAHFGTRFCGYTSNISITLPVNGKFSAKQRLIYNIVLQANREVVQNIQCNKSSIDQMNAIAHGIILRGLKEIGIIKGESDINEMIKNGLGKIFMPHTIGHSLGLDAHDVGLSETKPIKSGIVLTIDAGIYFIDTLMNEASNAPLLAKDLNVDCYNSYRGFGGIRISDTVVVNETSVVSYHEGLPKIIQEIELLMQNK